MTPLRSAVDLYWIPLGAGGHCVRSSGRVFEAIAAARRHRPRRELHHAVLVVALEGERYTIELTPAPGGDARSRGVVATGAVGSRHLGRLPMFRYEVRCWRGGTIGDLGEAVRLADRRRGNPHGARQPACARSRAGLAGGSRAGAPRGQFSFNPA